MSERLWFKVQGVLNETMYYMGIIANPEAWNEYPSLAIDMDPPWYHCRPCVDEDPERYTKARLSIGDKFCSECGAELDWYFESTVDMRVIE